MSSVHSGSFDVQMSSQAVYALLSSSWKISPEEYILQCIPFFHFPYTLYTFFYLDIETSYL